MNSFLRGLICKAETLSARRNTNPCSYRNLVAERPSAINLLARQTGERRDSSVVEQLICNHQVVGSNPTLGSLENQRITLFFSIKIFSHCAESVHFDGACAPSLNVACACLPKRELSKHVENLAFRHLRVRVIALTELRTTKIRMNLPDHDIDPVREGT